MLAHAVTDVLHSLAEGVFTVDHEFRITFFNDAAERITGVAKENALGQYCRTVLNADLCSSRCPIAHALENNQTLFDLESQIQDVDGYVIPIRVNAAVIRNSAGEPQGGVVSFRDMSSYKEIRRYLEHQTHFYGMVGISKPMREIFSLIEEVAKTDATVLIYGETGTGKELIADSLHQTGRRKDRPLVKVNCSILPPHLLASELFGHARGAFTDAIRERIGRFEFANGGTIFLDEVAEMPREMQLQILRVIQEGTFERLGESNTRKVDVRILAATNANLDDSIKQGTFRQDLFYRLNVIPIAVPPLRKRKEDIPLLLNHFIRKLNLHYKKELTEFDDKSTDILYRYDWPGNVREMENVVEYAVIRSKNGGKICACNLPANFKNGLNCPEQSTRPDMIPKSDLLKLLEKYRWNRTKVAKELGIDRTTLWRKLKEIGIS